MGLGSPCGHMPNHNAPLSALEVTALIQIRLQAQLDPKHRAAVRRLIHLGLIEEKPAGFFVTAAGDARCRIEGGQRGLT